MTRALRHYPMSSLLIGLAVAFVILATVPLGFVGYLGFSVGPILLFCVLAGLKDL